ncbi:hypothetical protein ScPMuIL_011831 [Solemya velum]
MSGYVDQRGASNNRPRYYNMIYHYGGDKPLPTWNTYLYHLQQEAPKPRRITCARELSSKPAFYGKEYHGNISRDEVDNLLGKDSGSYLVRKSERAPDAFTLAIRFDNITKNFKLYYDGMHYVGEKRFETVHDLVADGLIHFYVESRAADYIDTLSNESNYAESPYLAFSAKKTRLQSRRVKTVRRLDMRDSAVAPTNGQVIDQVRDIVEDDEDTNVQEFEKPHNFKTHNFIGLHWCDFCANFMWGLIAQGVKCQDCGFEAHKRCSEKVPSDCMPDIKFVKSIFGADLTTVVKAHKSSPIPVVVEKCVKEIEHRGLESEGLYRIAGLHDEMEMIRMEFDKDGEMTDISAARYDDINSITSVLKLYFRLLPIPLIPEEAYKSILASLRNDKLNQQELVGQVKEGLNTLPPAHYQTLKYMIGHLVRVTEKKSQNMMSSDNLAIVFAPTLMRSPDLDPIQCLMSAMHEQKAVEFIISKFRELFSK